MALEQHGYVSTRDARKHEINVNRLADLERSGQAERKAQGLYRLSIVPYDELDDFMFAAKWPRDAGVISHEGAAVLHGLNDINPTRIDVTVPSNYRMSIKAPAHLRIHKMDLDSDSITQYEGIPVVTAYRAVTEMIAFGTRSDLVRQAIETARRAAMITFEQQAMLVAQTQLGPHD